LLAAIATRRKVRTGTLRSIKPISNKSEKSTYKIPLPPSYGPPVTHVADVPRTNHVAYG